MGRFKKTSQPVAGGQGYSGDDKVQHGAPMSPIPEEAVVAEQGKTPDRRTGGTLTHDKANHDSLAGSGSGVSGAHKTVESGGDRGLNEPELANKQVRDYLEDVNFKNDPAGLHGLAGSGETKDKTEFARISETLDHKVSPGTDKPVDPGAMAAWGGMTKGTAYGGDDNGEVDISRKEYPMAGEATSGGGKGSVKGSAKD